MPKTDYINDELHCVFFEWKFKCCKVSHTFRITSRLFGTASLVGKYWYWLRTVGLCVDTGAGCLSFCPPPPINMLPPPWLVLFFLVANKYLISAYSFLTFYNLYLVHQSVKCCCCHVNILLNDHFGVKFAICHWYKILFRLCAKECA